MEPDLFPLDDQEARVLGCLVEKAMTTPDQYPMSLNGVRVACNQVSNREPVVDYDETTVATTLRRLADRGLAKFVHRAGDRVVKYVHAVGDVLEIPDREVAILAVLLLRGPQTPGELRQRTSRYVEFTSLPEVETTLRSMAAHPETPLATELERRPGQKEHRWRTMLCDTPGDDAHAAGDETPPVVATAAAPSTDRHDDGAAAGAPVATAADSPEATGAVAALRTEVAELRQRFERLLEALGVDEI